MNAANTCTKCSHATRPLPSDWTTVDFFDKPVIAQEAVFRTSCAAVADAAKPCLRPALAALQSEPKPDMSNTTELTPRQHTGLEACYQIEALLRSLMIAAQHGDMEDMQRLMRATLPRLVEMNSVAISALDTTDSEGVPSMIDRLHGGYIKLAKGGSV